MDESSRPELSVVIPVYNEASIVADTARALTEYLDGLFPGGEYEVIFSDDGSTDESAKIIAALGYPRVRLVSHKPNKGKGAAVRDGILAARGKYVLFTDCDLAYGTEVIGRFYGALDESGADAAIGSRRLHEKGYAGYTFLRKLASKVFYRTVALLVGFRFSDSQCGIKCFKTGIAQKIFSQCKIDGFAFDLEALMLYAKSGARVLELPVTIVNHRESKVHVFRDAYRMLRDVLKIKRLHR
ncbi:MAG: glycosyltransferase family 2 protein [Eubacteriales bacterium]|nr:glycosyltransferase family 2 protein [Clostridiales bacterium]